MDFHVDDEREKSRLLRGGGFSFWSNENVLKLTVVMVAHLGDYTKNHWIVHFHGRVVRYLDCISITLFLKKE